MKIYIPANSSEGMISALNSNGISSTDCSVCAQPQIYRLVDGRGGVKHNVIINPDNSYIFVKVDGGYMIGCTNPTESMIQQCSNVFKRVEKGNQMDAETILFLMALIGGLIFICAVAIHDYFK